MYWILFGAGVTSAIGLLLWARARARRLRPLPEALPACSVGELEVGRFRLTGRVVPIRVTASGIDGSPCVYMEHAEYRTVGSELVPLLRQVDYEVVAHPFYLDDGTGRILVDPAEAIVEAVTQVADAGLSAELRLRAGEEIELVASFQRAEVEAEGGPYRVPHETWVPVVDDAGPPRVSFRTEPGMVTPVDELSALLGGIGVMLLLLTAIAGVVAAAS